MEPHKQGITSDSVDVATWRRLVESANCASLLVAIRSRMGDRLRARLDPEDILQESLLQAWRDRERARFDSGRAFRSWLLTIIDHRLRDLAEHVHARKRGGGTAPVPLESPELEPSGSTTPSRMAAHREQAAAMIEALEGVPEESRAVLSLRVFQQLSLQQIGEQLGLTLAMVRSRLRRGAEVYRARLRAAGIGRSTLATVNRSAQGDPDPAS